MATFSLHLPDHWNRYCNDLASRFARGSVAREHEALCAWHSQLHLHVHDQCTFVHTALLFWQILSIQSALCLWVRTQTIPEKPLPEKCFHTSSLIHSCVLHEQNSRHDRRAWFDRTWGHVKMLGLMEILYSTTKGELGWHAVCMLGKTLHTCICNYSMSDPQKKKLNKGLNWYWYLLDYH